MRVAYVYMAMITRALNSLVALIHLSEAGKNTNILNGITSSKSWSYFIWFSSFYYSM